MNHPYSYPYRSDLGNGRYRNPVLHADYSDPDVIRVGEDYWMTASSFNCTPGLPILHSKDLVNWTLVNHAVKNLPRERFKEVQLGSGIWAPAIRYHAGKYWIVFPMVEEGIYVTTADDPRGEWCEPWCLVEARGWIDPCLFWDDDGKAYLIHAYAMSRSGKKEILHLRPMTPDAKTLLPGDKEIIHAPHHPYLEGPKFHKFNGWYYILAPGGSVQVGWQVVYRSKNIFGPYEEKVVLEQGSTAINGPHQGALVDIPSNNEQVPGAEGAWWFLHFQDDKAYGRITHMNPVHWVDGWPLMGVDYDGNGVGEPVLEWEKPAIVAQYPIAVPATTDEFDFPTLGLQWQWHGNHDDSFYSLSAREGWITLPARPLGKSEEGFLLPPFKAPHLMAQKFPAKEFSVEALLDGSALGEGSLAGLTIVGGGHSAWIALRKESEGWKLLFLLDIAEEQLLATLGNDKMPEVRLSVRVGSDANCVFSYALDKEAFTAVTPAFVAGEGGWLGAKVGILSVGSSGSAAFDYFRFS